jgi:esterase/lipase superfamily enzyme
MNKFSIAKTLLPILIIVHISSCSHEEVKPVIIPTPPIQVIVPPPVVVEPPKNLDLEFQKNLKNIWGSYFVENYDESRLLDIYVATNRKAKSGNFGCTNNYFGITPEELKDSTSNYKLGVCRINVPKNHSTGAIEINEDPRSNSHQYFKPINAKWVSEDHLLEFIKKTRRIPLIFVHGFNVKYQDAVLRAAQISYDLKYQGPVILFTWPSGAGDGFLDDKLLNKTYESNQKSAKQSVIVFKNFINKFVEKNIPLNIVVHSMGHQVVLPALNLIGKELTNSELKETNSKLINELILNAPDFDVSEFQNNVDTIKNTAKRITLYCSYNDKAMMASTSFNKTERLGACADVEGVDTINVGLIDDHTFGLGHSYYSSRAILTDVFQVLIGIDVEKRLFIKKSEPNSTEKFYLRN